MKPGDFANKVQARFEWTPKAVLGDIQNELKYYSESDIDKLWDAFFHDYTSTKSPTWAIINTIALSNSIYKKAKESGGVYWRCEPCGCAFVFEYSKCPKCGENYKLGLLKADVIPDDIIRKAERCENENQEFPKISKIIKDLEEDKRI